MTERRRGVVIGNCQAQPLSVTLNFFSRDVEFDYYSIHILPAATREQAIAEFVETARAKYEIVLPAPLSDDYGPLATNRIRETFPGATVLSIPNFYFAGLQPDLTYLGGLGQRILGPLGDYHSKLAVMGYARGVPLGDLEQAFNGATYEAANYFASYRSSLDELRRRESDTDLGFSAELEDLLTQDLCFFSVNHPTSFLFGHFVDKLSRHLADAGLVQRMRWPPLPSTLPNQLGISNIFPVFPEIAEAHGLRYGGSYLFKPALGPGRVNVMDLSEFLAGEYACFEAFGREKMQMSAQVSGIVAQLGGIF